MKLHLQGAAGLNLITGYGAGYVAVNGVRHTVSLILTADTLLRWPPTAFAALAAGHFDNVVQLAPEILVLGTGARLQFPAPPLTRALVEARIGVEVMDTPAACRTYNILMGEGRKVAAALIIEPGGLEHQNRN
ncbi:MAG: Mth938-like domain-containing protein [Burkholderiales bacterium]